MEPQAFFINQKYRMAICSHYMAHLMAGITPVNILTLSR